MSEENASQCDGALTRNAEADGDCAACEDVELDAQNKFREGKKWEREKVAYFVKVWIIERVGKTARGNNSGY